MTKHHCHLCVQKQKVIYMAPNSIGLCLVIAINKKKHLFYVIQKKNSNAKWWPISFRSLLDFFDNVDLDLL